MSGGYANLKPYAPGLSPAISVLPPPDPKGLINSGYDYVSENLPFIRDLAKYTQKGTKNVLMQGLPVSKLAEQALGSELARELTAQVDFELKNTLKSYLRPTDAAKDLFKAKAQKFDIEHLKLNPNESIQIFEKLTPEIKDIARKGFDIMQRFLLKIGIPQAMRNLKKSNPEKFAAFFKSSVSSGAKFVTILGGILNALVAFELASYIKEVIFEEKKMFETYAGVSIPIPTEEFVKNIAKVGSFFVPSLYMSQLVADLVGHSDFMQTSAKALGTDVAALQSGISYNQAIQNMQNENLYGVSSGDDQTKIFLKIQQRFRLLLKQKYTPDQAKEVIKKEFAQQILQAKQIYQQNLNNGDNPEVAYAKTFLPKFNEMYSRVKFDKQNFVPKKVTPYSPEGYGYYSPGQGGGAGYGKSMPAI